MGKKRELVASRENPIFTLYRDVNSVGNEMKNDFFESKYTFRKDPSRFVFRMSETNDKEGVLGLSYGTFLLSTLMDRFDIESKFQLDEKKKLENSIIELLKYVEEHGFDVSPFGRSTVNSELFGWEKGQQSFIESLTWSMSSFLYAKRLHDKGMLQLDEYLDDITRWIAKCLAILLNSVICENGEVGYKEGRTDYIGWGPISGCTETSLYFTHSVCETFGDIEDTMLGNYELGIEKNVELISQVNEEFAKLPERSKIKGDVVEIFQNVCLCVGKNLYNKYKDSLGKRFFYADGSEVTSTDQIAYAMQSPVLLNQLYVVLSMVYVNYHKEVELEGEEAYKDFGAILKSAVDMVYETYVSLHRKGKANIVNREYTTFSEKHPNKKYGQLLANERINVAILETLIIKARAMIVTYVTKYPEKEMEEILNILDETRSQEGGWLWSNIGYDLQHTERSISAIREFYDYYEGFQKIAAEKQSDELVNLKSVYEEKYRGQEESLAAAKKNYEEQLKAIQEKYENDLQAKVSEVKQSYKLEAVVREIVEEQIKESFVELLVGTLGRIAEDNETAKDTLNDKDKLVKDTIGKLVLSYLIPFNFAENRSEDIKDAWKNEKIVAAMKDDAGYFVKEWVRRVCINNTQDADLRVQILSELFSDTTKDE